MKLKGIIKLVVSVLMLGLILRVTDFKTLEQTIRQISLGGAAIVVLGYLFGQILSSYKWWNIARAGDIPVSYGTALKAYFIGTFVNCFGFGTLGGDLARGILLVEGKPLKSVAVASVVADRLHGLATLAMIGAVAAAVFGSQTLEPLYHYLVSFFGIAIFAGWFLGPRLVKLFIPTSNPWRKKIDAVLAVFPHKPETVLFITAISIIFHCIQIGLHQIMAHAIGIHIPWAYLFIAIPFVNIVSSLPISWMGLGVRENAYRFFLVPAVLSPEQAIAFGAMWLFASTVTSAIGGLISVLTKDFDVIAHAESESASSEVDATPRVP